jgi:hypothetical protein
MSADTAILPGTGRGTIRRMVEGVRYKRSALPHAPSTTLLRACWGEIVFPGHDLGQLGAGQCSNTLPVPGRSA